MKINQINSREARFQPGCDDGDAQGDDVLEH